MLILLLLPYVAVVFRTGSMNGRSVDMEETGVEEYVAGILPGQMPITYEEEALKAQTVIIRTSLVKKSMEYYEADTIQEAVERMRETDLEDMGFVYYTPEKLEEIWGYEQWEHYAEKIQCAVKATEGQILVQGDTPVDLPYHAVSAGKTRDGAVLGEEYSYLKSAECPDDIESADYLKIQKLSIEEVPRIIARDEAGYVTKIQLGDQEMGGEEFRSRYSLNSSCFTIEETEEGIRIVTKGLGHGLGLSMYQANQMAYEGKKYLEILRYFYKNVECISFS